MKPLRSLTPALAVLLLLAGSVIAQAASLTGTVTNKTVNKPSVGDDVVLLNLTQGMTEAGRTKTDAKGSFTFNVPDPGPHLIRVEHMKGSYFKQAPPGTQSVEIDVYDVATKVEGISTEADVLRIEADNTGLKITENYFVKNQSDPPRTQFSDHAYEIYLPLDAKIEGSAAMAPNGMPVASSPVPLAEKGHYAFAFPLRPGETRFQLSYSLPYTGSYKFTPRLAMGAENLAIMLPKGMTFTPGKAATFQSVNEDVTAQTFIVKNAAPGQSLEFTVSGTGSMPREAQGADAQQASGGSPDGAGPTVAAPGAASADNRPGGGLGVPVGGEDPINKYRYWILGGLSVVLAVAAGFLLRKPATLPAAPGAAPVAATARVAAPLVTTPASSADATLTALKEELFTLETDKLQGKVSDAEYTEHKAALETLLKRALARKG